MSHQPAKEPTCTTATGAIRRFIEPQAKDLGGFSVRRVLPAPGHRMVGPFIFFDHMGPAEFPPGQGIQVRPHPHIGLATITYLFEGEIIHRDNLGFVQPIRPGAVNLMTAGRGVVHSERAGEDLGEASSLHGIQSWTALPDALEECEPSFIHYPRQALPEFKVGQVAVRLIMGEAFGEHSPVLLHSPTLYLDCRMPAGSQLNLPDAVRERALYIISGAVRAEDTDCAEGVMAVVTDDRAVRIAASQDSHLVVIGGDPVGKRHIWWNLVSSSRERIEQAKADWKEGRFGTIPGETEFIPLPE